jgi:Trypsin-like peptidase domain
MGVTMDKLFVAVSGLVVMLLGVICYVFTDKTTYPTTTADYVQTTVMVLNMNKDSGGTGVVLTSTNENSTVLTNKHVCNLIKRGGLVIKDSHDYLIKAYKISREHDLCLLSVSNNLGVNTQVNPMPPRLYSKAVISGHPHLLPTTVTENYFGGKLNIKIMVGLRVCTEDDLKNAPEDEKLGIAIMCLFLGGIPVTELFETQLIPATIMPGSSGSAVWSNNGYISGLVFAGMDDFSYAFAVPWAYLYKFIYYEADRLPWEATKLTNEAGLTPLSTDKLKLFKLIKSLVKLPVYLNDTFYINLPYLKE